MRIIFVTLLLTAFAFGQQLPDAPSSVVDNTMVGMVCVCNTENNWHVIEAQPEHTSFLKGRRWTEPPLRTNQEILHSKSFRLLQLGIWASVGADLARNWNNKTNPTQPHGGELLVDALLPAAVNTAMVWGSYKYIWAPIGAGTGIYGIFIHTRSAIDGVYH